MRKIKDWIIPVLIIFVGVALSVTSFCVYYLVKPLNTVALIAICSVDFLYTLFSACCLIKAGFSRYWLLKGILLSVGYIAVFIAILTIGTIAEGTITVLKTNILRYVFYAFFTGPCLLIILAIIMLIAYLVNLAN